MSKRLLIALGVLLLLVAAAIVVWRGRELGPPPAPVAKVVTSGGAAAAQPSPVAVAVVELDAGSRGPAQRGPVRWSAKWGAGPGQLGRSAPQEGNPEAPMSFAPAPDGSLVVLDQVNGRLVRFGRDGAPTDLPLTQRTPQDLAIADDGTMAILDRHGDRDVALVAPDGRALGSLPLEGKNLPNPAAATGVFIDGQEVYVEREHGQLVHLGDTRGNADPTRGELQGRPTRDGRFTLLAGIIDGATGRLFLAINERPSGKNRFTRELDLPRRVIAISLLDSDARGTVYLAALQADDAAPPELALLCADEQTGKLLGEVALPANTGPEETMRDLVVLEGGGVLDAQRTDDGVTFRVASCP